MNHEIIKDADCTIYRISIAKKNYINYLVNREELKTKGRMEVTALDGFWLIFSALINLPTIISGRLSLRDLEMEISRAIEEGRKLRLEEDSKFLNVKIWDSKG